MVLKIQIAKLLKGCLFALLTLFILTSCTGMKNWFSFLEDANQVKTEQLDAKDLENMYNVKPAKGDLDSQYRLARHFQKQSRHEIAIEEFLKILKTDPGFYNAYNALGVSYDYLKKHDHAINAYNEALKINPDLSYVHNNIGYSNLLKGDLKVSATAFEKAIALNADNKTYQNNLALVLAKSGQKPSMVADPLTVNQVTIKKDSITLEILDRVIDKAVAKKKKKPLSPKNEKNFYAIQLGAYYDLNNAVKILKMAQKKGYDCPYITKIEKRIPYYRVRFGKYKTRSDARALALKILDKKGRPALTIIETYPIDVFHAMVDKNCSDINIQYVVLQKDLQIKIFNGNGIDHMAKRFTKVLRQKGFQVIHPSNANHFNHPLTKIYYAPGNYQDAQKLARTITGFEIAGEFIESTKIRANIRILMGKDIIAFNEELKEILN